MDRVAAILLAGGQDKHFGALSRQRSKSALPVAGYHRIIDFALTNLGNSGIRQVGVAIQFLPAPLMEHIGAGRSWGFNMADRSLRIMTPFIGVNETRWFNGTADAVAQNLNLLNVSKHQDILILSGDHVYSMDYGPLLARHRETQADLTMVYVERSPDQQHPRFGNLVLGEDGRIDRFIEKPETPVCSQVSIGVFLFKRDVLLDLLDAGSPAAPDGGFQLPRDVIAPHIDGLRAFGMHFDGEWHYLADLYEYFDFHLKLARGQCALFNDHWNVLTNNADRLLGSRPPCYLSPDSSVGNSLISPGCRIEGEVIDSVLSPGVRVARGSRVVRSILYHDVVVGPDCSIVDTIADKDVCFAEGTRVGADSPTGAEDGPSSLALVPKGMRVRADEAPSLIQHPESIAVI